MSYDGLYCLERVIASKGIRCGDLIVVRHSELDKIGCKYCVNGLIAVLRYARGARRALARLTTMENNCLD